MSVLVIGATGTVGSEVVRALRARGAAVRALVRAPERAAKLASAGVELVRGDVRDRQALERAARGARAIFYVSPHEPDEEALARNVVEAAASADARLVFLGVHADGRNRFERALRRLFFGALLPHYKPKLRLSEYVRTSEARTVILVATNFFQNDELFRDEILAGELVTPLSAKGVNRVDVRDIGDAAARALLDEPELPDGAYPVVGPVSLSGEASAATWTRVRGEAVRYTGGDFGRFEAAARRILGGKKLEDILASYRALAKIHVPTEARDLRKTTELLGRAPRSYEEYVRDALVRWTSELERPFTSSAGGSRDGGATATESISRG